MLAGDLVVHDRRLAGQGRVEGAGAYLGSVEVLWELAPDGRVEAFVLALERHGMVVAARTFGTLPEGGASRAASSTCS